MRNARAVTPEPEKEKGRLVATIAAEHCKGCGICTEFCPPKILTMGKQMNSYGYQVVEMTDITACRGCLFCSLMCPDVVFTFARKENRYAGNDERQ